MVDNIENKQTKEDLEFTYYATQHAKHEIAFPNDSVVAVDHSYGLARLEGVGNRLKLALGKYMGDSDTLLLTIRALSGPPGCLEEYIQGVSQADRFIRGDSDHPLLDQVRTSYMKFLDDHPAPSLRGLSYFEKSYRMRHIFNKT